MRKVVSRWWALATLFAGAFMGCSSEPDAPGPQASTEDPLGAALARDTGVPWLIERDAAGSVFLAVPLGSPRPLSSGAAAEDAARELYRRYASLLGVVEPDRELMIDEVRETGAGVRDVLFVQRAAGSGLPVWNGGSAVHLAPDGSIAWAQPTLVHGTGGLPRSASWTPEQALASARSAVAQAMPGRENGALVRPPELGVIATTDGPHLAYAVGLTAASSAPLALVDAVSGRVLEVRDAMSGFIATAYTAAHYLPQPFGSDEKRSFLVMPPTLVSAWTMERPAVPNVFVGIKTLSYVASAGEVAKGDPIQADIASDEWDATNARGAGSAVDAYTNTTTVVDWYGNPAKLKHRSFDGKGKDVRVYVHRDMKGAAAGYTPSDDALNFDDVAPSSILPPAVALDITAHEFTHAVTNHASAVGWLGTDALQGPLDEALSDIFAATLEHDLSPGPGNMRFGEVLSPQGKRAYRDHLAPASPDVVAPQLDALPDPHWSGWGKNRYDSAGVPTKAWSLMVSGGEHRGIAMPAALGWDMARDLFWQSLRSLRSHSSFWTPHALAWGQILAAKAPARGLTHDQIDTVACAWIAVNALDIVELTALHTLEIGTTCARTSPGPTPKPAPTIANECAGHGDTTICPAIAGPFAQVCKKGMPMATTFCADLAQRCVRVSPGDPTAALTPDGTLICE